MQDGSLRFANIYHLWTAGTAVRGVGEAFLPPVHFKPKASKMWAERDLTIALHVIRWRKRIHFHSLESLTHWPKTAAKYSLQEPLKVFTVLTCKCPTYVIDQTPFLLMVMGCSSCRLFPVTSPLDTITYYCCWRWKHVVCVSWSSTDVSFKEAEKLK